MTRAAEERDRALGLLRLAGDRRRRLERRIGEEFDRDLSFDIDAALTAEESAAEVLAGVEGEAA